MSILEKIFIVVIGRLISTSILQSIKYLYKNVKQIFHSSKVELTAIQMKVKEWHERFAERFVLWMNTKNHFTILGFGISSSPDNIFKRTGQGMYILGVALATKLVSIIYHIALLNGTSPSSHYFTLILIIFLSMAFALFPRDYQKHILCKEVKNT